MRINYIQQLGLPDLVIDNIYKNYNYLIINNIEDFEKINNIDYKKNIIKIIFGYYFNNLLNYNLNNFTNLHTLKLGYYFNQNLGNSLDNLIHLKILEFEYMFNQNLGNSLDNLTNLKILKFGKYFNQHLKNNLNKLNKLKQIILPINYKLIFSCKNHNNAFILFIYV
jgi:hypothetical protein